MPAPVTRSTIHHEGGGAPSDNMGRFSEGGYTYGIGATRWERFRDVWSSYATLNYNHVSLDICLSGNRMDHAVTDADIALIAGAAADARARGYIGADVEVVAHKNSPGSATACPGDNTMARWADVVAAVRGSGAAPAPPDVARAPEAPLTVVVSPQKANPAGRVPTARPIPAFGTVALDNGASVEGDVDAGGYSRVWVNPDKVVTDKHAPLVDIAATVGGDGRPDGRGIVALYDLGDGNVGTYTLKWR